MRSKSNADSDTARRKRARRAPSAALIDQIGRVVANISLYGEHHRLTLSSVRGTYNALKEHLEEEPSMVIGTSEGELCVNGKPIPDDGFAHVVRERFDKLDLTSFTLNRGMTRQDFQALLELLANAGGRVRRHQKAVQASDHIQLDSGSYELVGKDETVVKRDKTAPPADPTANAIQAYLRRLEKAHTTEPTGATRTPSADIPAAPASPGAGVSQIMAFLKGNVETPNAHIAKGLEEMASDSEKLANLILEAAVVRQRQSVVQGESLNDLIIGCLRRTFNGIRTAPGSTNRQPDMKRSLLMLEKRVLDKLHTMIDGVESFRGDVPWDTDGLDEVEVATLTTEYVRRRRNFERIEREVVEHMRQHHSPEENDMFRENLELAGLPQTGWHELVARSGGDPGFGPGPLPSSGNIGALAMLLSQLDKLMEEDTPDTSRAETIIGQVGEAVHRAANDTTGKIGRLEAALASPADESVAQPGADRQLGGRELLAEITQELCQPATALACSVSLVLEGYFGELTPQQKETLETASTCGERIVQLLERLKEVVGYPGDFIPRKNQVRSERTT